MFGLNLQGAKGCHGELVWSAMDGLESVYTWLIIERTQAFLASLEGQVLWTIQSRPGEGILLSFLTMRIFIT